MSNVFNKNQDVWIIPLGIPGSVDKVLTILEDGDVILYSVLFVLKDRLCKSTFSHEELRAFK